MSDCHICTLVAQRDAGAAPLWDSIYRTAYWDIVHAYNTSLPGWLVLVTRAHHDAVAELSEEAAVDLGQLIRLVSQAVTQVTGCIKTYVVQFAEAEGHRHVHVHIIPRMADQPDDRRGPKIFGYLGVPEAERVSEAQMNEIALAVRAMLVEAF